jgi:hypothetical protein
MASQSSFVFVSTLVGIICGQNKPHSAAESNRQFSGASLSGPPGLLDHGLGAQGVARESPNQWERRLANMHIKELPKKWQHPLQRCPEGI